MKTNELIVDNFAGAGGASTGIFWATGRHPDIAINHDPVALAVHRANHAESQHLIEDVWDVDPVVACAGRPVGLAWFSPDCTYFSRARGGQLHRHRRPALRRRALAHVVIRWAKAVRPRIICLENVEEFARWGPLNSDGMPCAARAGKSFRTWCAQLRRLGYELEWRTLAACDFGAPTARRRLFLVARCDGEPISWPAPTHGPGRQPYRTAAECIDWTLPVPSIFARKRPLAENTLRRIARGIQRFVIEAGEPFIAPLRGTSPAHTSVHSVDAPLSTVSAGGTHHGLVAAFLAKHYSGVTGHSLDRPIGTVTTVDHHSLVTGQLSLQPYAGVDRSESVRAFLVKYYGNEREGANLRLPLGTVTTRDRFALVTVAGTTYRITDIGMRMLQPAELFRAQGFPSHYTSAPEVRSLPKTVQVRLCGNSVAPQVAAAVVRANLNFGWAANTDARAANVRGSPGRPDPLTTAAHRALHNYAGRLV